MKQNRKFKGEEMRKGLLPVEKGRLADIGAADDDDGGEEGGVDFGEVDSRFLWGLVLLLVLVLLGFLIEIGLMRG